MEEIRPSTHPEIILKSKLYNEKRGITPLMALKLSNYFKTTPQFWMNLQNAYDLYKTYEKQKEQIEKIGSLVA